MLRRETLYTRHAGFSLIEVLITVVIAGILLLFGVPALQAVMAHRRHEGFARSIAMLCHRARHESLKRGAPAVLGLENGAMIAFVDVNGASPGDPPDGVYNPDTSLPDGTDYMIGEHRVPSHLFMEGPGGSPAADGFTDFGGGVVRAVFDPDGSIRQTGAFRVRDERGNFLEVRVEPQATARIDLRKWNGTAWQAQGEGGSTWDWI
jgi:prepilin-type N-terminal cleavage/methylation domain-containing protein